MVGGLIMCHGDDGGLRVPPRLAHIQVVVLAVKADVADRAHELAATCGQPAYGSRSTTAPTSRSAAGRSTGS